MSKHNPNQGFTRIGALALAAMLLIGGYGFAANRPRIASTFNVADLAGAAVVVQTLTVNADESVAGHLGVTGYIQITGGGSPLYLGSSQLFVNTAPTISSGFGTSPSIAGTNTSTFRINVGTGGVATTGVIGLPSAVATAWNCLCSDMTTTNATAFMCKQTSSTSTTVTIGNFTTAGVAGAWVASDIVLVQCIGY